MATVDLWELKQTHDCTDKHLETIEILEQHGPLTIDELIDYGVFNYSQNASTKLGELEDQGLVVWEQESLQDPKYWDTTPAVGRSFRDAVHEYRDLFVATGGVGVLGLLLGVLGLFVAVPTNLPVVLILIWLLSSATMIVVLWRETHA